MEKKLPFHRSQWAFFLHRALLRLLPLSWDFPLDFKQKLDLSAIANKYFSFPPQNTLAVELKDSLQDEVSYISAASTVSHFSVPR